MKLKIEKSTTMYKNIFIEWFEDAFSGEMVRDDMVDTIEDSPYHREDNVWVHTEMVVHHYISLAPDIWSIKDLMGALMCAFHDTGKPMAEEVLTRSDGTTYRRYSNHDVNSANIFVDYFFNHREDTVFNDLCEEDVYNIFVMIAYHQPYRLRDDKYNALTTHMHTYNIATEFCRGLLADAKGRIADDQAAVEVAAHEWCKKFVERDAVGSATVGSKKVYVLCGCSGIGKSTFTQSLQSSSTTDCAVHSMDSLRLELYSNDYSTAWQMSTDDPEFGNKVSKDFHQKVKANNIVVVDNTNLSWKRRKQYLNVKRDFVKIGVVCMASFDTVIQRQNNRVDKKIPYNAVRNMYYSHKPPIIGEVDEIKIVGLSKE